MDTKDLARIQTHLKRTFGNPHFDQNGNDTLAQIDFDYLTSIARPAIAFQAAVAGVPQR